MRAAKKPLLERLLAKLKCDAILNANAFSCKLKVTNLTHQEVIDGF